MPSPDPRPQQRSDVYLFRQMRVAQSELGLCELLQPHSRVVRPKTGKLDTGCGVRVCLTIVVSAILSVCIRLNMLPDATYGATQTMRARVKY